MRLTEREPYRIAKQQASRPPQSRPPQRSLVLVQPPYNDMGFGPLLQTESAIPFSAKGWVGLKKGWAKKGPTATLEAHKRDREAVHVYPWKIFAT